MSFAVAASAYDRFMGRYSAELAAPLADLADVSRGHRALDVGCGPGALTGELVERLGASAVSAVDPSDSFVAAARERHPGVDVGKGAAERLPYPDRRFDRTLAQLVVHFMADPVAGLGEMRRVTVGGGVVAACVWDHAPGGAGPLNDFWAVAQELDPAVHDESELAGAREGHLVELFVAAGLHDVEAAVLTATVEHSTFEDWWEPFTLGVGPAGAHVASLAPVRRDELRERLRERLPDPPFVRSARAWAARGIA